jgi:hypothetical protein
MRSSPADDDELTGSHPIENLLARRLEMAVVNNLLTERRENVPEGVRLYRPYVRCGRGRVLGFASKVARCQAARTGIWCFAREAAFGIGVATGVDQLYGTLQELVNPGLLTPHGRIYSDEHTRSYVGPAGLTACLDGSRE